MNPHEWFIEHRTEFAVRILEPGEEASFREHLLGCPECREAVAALERELGWLPMGVAPVAPPPGMAHRMVDRILAPRRPRFLVWPVGIAAGLGLLLGGVGGMKLGSGQGQVARLEAAVTATQDTLTIMRAATRVLQARIEMDGHQGSLMIFADERTHRWNVLLRDLPAAQPGQVYQFWFITDQGMVRSVEFHCEKGAPGFVTLPMPPSGGNVMGAALSVEQVKSTGSAPQGPMLAHLML
ncbi:MAG TPA: anti-sigma factor [Gemmatimonadales bacterium]|nr:anti-sigma factor [Gemmatimonadales bacterium]